MKSLSGNSMVSALVQMVSGVYLLLFTNPFQQAYPVFSLSVSAPGKEVSLGKVF